MGIASANEAPKASESAAFRAKFPWWPHWEFFDPSWEFFRPLWEFQFPSWEFDGNSRAFGLSHTRCSRDAVCDWRRPSLRLRRHPVQAVYGGEVSGHPLDPVRARRPRLERIAEILGLAGHFPIEELHDADGVRR